MDILLWLYVSVGVCMCVYRKKPVINIYTLTSWIEIALLFIRRPSSSLGPAINTGSCNVRGCGNRERGSKGDPPSSNCLSPGWPTLLQWLITGCFESEVAHEVLLSELRGQGLCKKVRVREMVISVRRGAIRQLFTRRKFKQTKLGETISDGRLSARRISATAERRWERGKKMYRHIKAAVKTTNRATLLMQSPPQHVVISGPDPWTRPNPHQTLKSLHVSPASN